MNGKERYFGCSLFLVEEGAVSLTPNFSWVDADRLVRQPLQRFSRPGLFKPSLEKTAEAVEVPLVRYPPN